MGAAAAPAAAAAWAPLPPVPRWPTPPRSEASCGTTISEPQHSGGGGSGGVLGAAGFASPEHSSRPAAMETSPGAVIAGGAQEGEQQPLPDPLAGHPRYRKVRDLNWWVHSSAMPCAAIAQEHSAACLCQHSGRQGGRVYHKCCPQAPASACAQKLKVHDATAWEESKRLITGTVGTGAPRGLWCWQRT